MKIQKTVYFLSAILISIICLIPYSCSDDEEKITEPEKTVTHTVYLRDWEYLEGKIFDLGGPGDFQEGDKIIFIQVYEFDSSYPGSGLGDTAVMYVDPGNPDLYPGEKLESLVNPIEPSKFDIDVHVSDSDMHTIMFYNSINIQDREIGVYMEMETPEKDTIKIGDISQHPYRLKLIKHRTPSPEMVTWDYQWRNVYSYDSLVTLADDIHPEGLSFDIFNGAPGTEGDSVNVNHKDSVYYITILGLDQSSAMPGEVNVHDFHTVDVYNHILIFSHRRPFDTDTLYAGSNGVVLDSAEMVPEIYNHPRGHPDIQAASKYYIEFKCQATE